MKNTSTKFPECIDGRLYFCDIDVSQVPIMKNYYIFLNAENYTRASEYLNNSEVYFYGAWLLNLLENRLCAIGEYLMKEEKSKLTTMQEPEPQNASIGFTWIY